MFWTHDARRIGGSPVVLFIGSPKTQYGIRQGDFSQVSDSFCLWLRRTSPVAYKYPLLPYPNDWDGDDDDESVGMALEISNDPRKISGRLVGRHADFGLIKSWLDDCTMHHGTTTCQPDATVLQDIAGLMVIDCSSRRLVSWSQLPTSQNRNYVALSYVRGTQPDKASSAARTWGHKPWTAGWPLPSTLPALIEDVITAVLKLGFRYLWIDRYCIPQGNQEAKHAQIQNMDRIYGSASLTIIAAASNDPSQGLPGVSLPRYGRFRANKTFSHSVQIGSRTFVTVDTSKAPFVVRNSRCHSRAWTMQEAFLSCRCLVFLDDGAYFQCSSPSSHRFEALYEPPALLKLKHEVLCAVRKEDDSAITRIWPAGSLILTKVGKAGNLQLGWCLQLVEDYFLRSMTFEDDILNAFSGILKYLHSLTPPVPNLWGTLMLPEDMSTPSGQRMNYNFVRGLAWTYYKFGVPENLEGTTTAPRKDVYPSWTWADWRFQIRRDGKQYFRQLKFPNPDSRFTSLVDLSVELDDGRIVSCSPGFGEDVMGLTTLPNPPRILHIQGYTANPQLRYLTEKEWLEFHERTIFPTKEAHAHGGNGRVVSEVHVCSSIESRRWISVDADGQHLKVPFEEINRRRPWCWGGSLTTQGQGYEFGWDAYHRHMQREKQADTTQPSPECTIDYRAILLGYNQSFVFYMMLIKAPGTDSQTETFERVNVRQHNLKYGEPAEVEELLAELTGRHAESYPGTPWLKMNTRMV